MIVLQTPKVLSSRKAEASGVVAAVWAGADVFFSLTRKAEAGPSVPAARSSP
jgi:hypothetical protein